MEGQLDIRDDSSIVERQYDCEKIKRIYRDGEKLYIEMKEELKEVIYEREDAKNYLNQIRTVITGFKAEKVPKYQVAGSFMENLKEMIKRE